MTNNIICFKEIKLPDLPINFEPKDYLLDPAVQKTVEKQQEKSKIRRSKFSHNGVDYKNAYYKSYSIENKELFNQLEKWFRELPLIKDFRKTDLVEKVNYAIHYQTSWGANWHSPHTDNQRRGQLIYILETGGDDVITTWYYEKGQTINSSEYLSNITENEDLIELVSVKLKPRTWYYFRTDVIHGAKGLTGQRTALCMTFKNEKFHQKFLTDYIAGLV